MYLCELFIKNSGPIKDLHIDFSFDENGYPVPHVIVGRNGSGKTNLLSIIAEALMHGAGASVYNDVLAQQGLGRSFFRILGGKTLTYGQGGGFAILRFIYGDDTFFYRENSGDMTPARALELIPQSLADGVKWNEEQQSKNLDMPEDKVREIYGSGVYVYFPSSRSENPFWFNPASIVEDQYDVAETYASTLGKPMFVEHGIDAFAQWLLGVITESRLPVMSANDINDAQKELIDKNQVMMQLDAAQYMRTQRPLVIANDILKTILNDPEARFEWMGRRISRKVGVLSADRPVAVGLDSLSGGQATLLAIFGTILRYADMGQGRIADLRADDIRGLVVIDELDAHMHVDLQMSALPKLIAMFPKVQFIVSSHSPIFALGMENNLPDNGVRIIDLPTGLAVNAESYTEFESALRVLVTTHAFEEKLGEFLAAAELPVIWVGGETDLPYFRTAAKLGYSHLIDYFEWIGAPGQGGGGSYTGDDSLKAAVKFLRANPDFTHRKVIVLYDNDAKQADENFSSVTIIGLPTIDGAFVQKGVENLLPAHVFTSDVIDLKEIPSGIEGQPKIIPEIRKRVLSERVCGNDADPANFENFRPILERINEIVSTQLGSSASPT